MNNKEITDKLISIFRDNDIPLQINEISRLAGISSESPQFGNLKKCLNTLIEQGIVVKKKKRKYLLKDYSYESTLSGILKFEHDRIYVDTDSYLKRVYIKRKHLRTAFNRDSVEIRVTDVKKNGKAHAEVIRIVKRADRKIKGIIDSDGEFSFLVPEDKTYYVDFLIHNDKLKGAIHGDLVEAKFLHWDDPLKSPVAEVTAIIGKSGKAEPIHEIEHEYDSIVNEFLLPGAFSPEVIDELSGIPQKVSPSIIKNRLDLRNDLIITIDPEDAKDFDDALSLEILPNGNYYLGVHIADVSHYVTEGSETDSEAGWRGTSVYLVDRVVPMLPELLSNEVCSLKPGRVRLTMSVFMEFTAAGALKKYEISESVIKSKRRYNYEEVLKIIGGAEDKNSGLIKELDRLAKLLRSRRLAKGGVDFNTFEVKFILDENKIPAEAVIKTTTASTSLVEECMLAANKAVAKHIGKMSSGQKSPKNLPYLYRVHDNPDAGKLNDVLEFLRGLSGGKRINSFTSKELNEYIRTFDGKPQKHIVHQLLLRTMAKAEYSDTNIGHYGLGFEEYTHFTSPIRRYPDLIVHRLIKEYSGEKIPRKRIKYLEDKIEEIAVHSTGRERLAMEAERATVKLAQTLYTRKHLGQKFNGTVSGVTNFGIFVLMDGILTEGLIHMRDLSGDYYVFDEKKYCLIGRRSKRMFSLGKRVCVQIMDVNIKRRRIDLKLVSDKEMKEK